jgi:hypothetical protein
MLSRLTCSLFPDLRRIEGERQRRVLWAAAYAPVLRSPAYWLVALAAQVFAQVVVVVPVTRLLRVRGLYRPVYEWALPVGVALLACLLIVWVMRRQITRNIRRELNRRRLPTCLKCGYNLTGNASGSCPECGHTQQPGASEEIGDH